jgi:hypothetical protein
MTLFAQQAAADAPRQETEFYWRRLSEQPEIFGFSMNFDPLWWWAFIIPLALITIAFVVWIYAKDARTVGGGWASLLTAFRLCTFACLFFLWFLPAVREVEITKQQSRVLMLFDVSSSMQNSDDEYVDEPGRLRRSRQDLVLQLLHPGYVAQGQDRAEFLNKLVAKNPVYVYRYGQRLDPTPRVLRKDALLAPDEWAEWLQPRDRQTLADGVRRDVVQFLSSAAAKIKESDDKYAGEQTKDEAAKNRRERQVADEFTRRLTDAFQVQDQLTGRTNLSGALLDMLRKESGNMIQGVVIFSDGRLNAGNSKELEEAQEIARKADIPLFTVGVGRHLETLNLRLVDLAAPNRVQPEDEYPVRIAIEGENVPANQEVEVELYAQRPDRTEPEPLEPKKVRLNPSTGKLSTGSAEFTIKNPEKIKGQFKYWAQVKPLKGESIRGDNRTPLPALVAVDERKLNVLVVGGSPSRDFQFLLTLLIREKEKFDVYAYLQTAEKDSVVGLPPERVLFTFPDTFKERDADRYNLANYEVIVAIDPNFRNLAQAAQDNLYRWCAKQGGGFIYVAGPVNTFDVAREKDLATIRKLIPVDLDDTQVSVQLMDRTSREPWALNWEPMAFQLPYLNLTDTAEAGKSLEGFEQFFWQEADKPVEGEIQRTQNGIATGSSRRGFYTFFPIKNIKPGANILARFSDGTDKKFLTNRDGPMPGQLQPYMASYQVEGKGPTFYIGSMETYRIRSYSEKFHERLWTKLIRQMGKGDQSRGSKRGVIAVGQRYHENDVVEVQALIFDPNYMPYVQSKNPELGDVKLFIKTPDGVEPPKEWTQGVTMKADEARGEGWYTARFPVKRGGRYEVEVAIPASLERLKGSFEVEAIDPERDFTRPDFAALHRLASEFTAEKPASLDNTGRRNASFTGALTNAKAAMQKQAKDAPPDTIRLDPKENLSKERLFVTLPDSVYIPPTLTAKETEFRTEGKAQDLWDKGWDILWKWNRPQESSGPPLALLVIMLFLSAEWLTRKLIRLA